MSMILPVNIGDLLSCRGIECERIEFKAKWDEATTAFQVLKTICAFANDLHNKFIGQWIKTVRPNPGLILMMPGPIFG